ncbi:MAG: hypothetical protein J7L38_02975 [Thermoproteales archaeon]|nr:hypothetical protein [Thermoproteales archaeon]RLE63025.1 MAG: hypothetical protein DRJ47_09850 [Thermoprotei archaeon]
MAVMDRLRKSFKKSKVKRRLKYYFYWTPLWVLLTILTIKISVTLLLLLQVGFLLKDFADILFKRKLVPDSFEHLPFSIFVFLMAGPANTLLLLLSSLDIILDLLEDVFTEKSK